jgi:predicted negative regulator of RcsB-dependent stress response
MMPMTHHHHLSEDTRTRQQAVLDLLNWRITQNKEVRQAETDHASQRYQQLCQALMHAKNDLHTITRYPKDKNLNRIQKTWE